MTDAKLLGELAVLDDVGPARRGRAYPAFGAASALLLPAGLLLGGLVLWPVLRTLHASVTDSRDGGFVGVDNFRTALSAVGAWPAVGRTVLWAAVVPAVVTVLGYVVAVASGRTYEGRLVRLILVAPIAVPLVVTAVIFRLMYDPDPGRGVATAIAARLLGSPPDATPSFLGPTLVTASLMSAFVWAWVGLAVVVFRAALAATPPDFADVVRAYGGGRADVFRDAQWRPLLRRTVAVVFALVALGTARTFDLILVMTPGSVRDEASVLSVQVWQTSGGSTSGPGAALGVMWLAAVAVGMLVASLGVRQAWPPPVGYSGAAQPDATESNVTESDMDLLLPKRHLAVLRGAIRSVPSAVAVAWAFPMVVLVATSLHSPRDAATGGWWAAPLRWDSYRRNFVGGTLTRSLVFTFVLAAIVTAVVLTVAMLAAYPLAWLTGPGAQASGVLLLATAVVPVQVIAGPVNEVLGVARLVNTAPGLALVHVALGLPFAVLVLRNALADVPAAQVRRARLAGRREWNMVWRMGRSIVPAVVAVCVLEFVQVWNDMAVGLLFSGPDAAPLGLLVYGQARQFVANSGPLAATSVIASILPVLLVILARRQVIAGLVTGAIK
jgi:alpha-glucoside transport system permease protein